MEADPEDLSAAAEVFGGVIGAIQDEQWQLPTPCSDWTVGDLVKHVVAGNDGFTTALGGRGAEPSGERSVGVSVDLADDYGRSVRALLDAFRQPGALQTMVTVPFGTVPGAVALHLRTTELLVHGWDLARATGQDVTFPDDLAEQELAFTRAALAQVPSERKPFAPPEPVADDASAIDRLAACLGRAAADPPGEHG
ncbi:MAG TPA: TIGR03086 family metal-binding protein [Acidimicrobiales bacterium]|nr:TIGR03086 family metal-binding protein [Acidimicrobiales bacterium]